MPTIMGALGMIKKDTDKHIKKITGRLSQYDIRKTSLCLTAHLPRRALSMWLGNITQKRQQKHKYIECI